MFLKRNILFISGRHRTPVGALRLGTLRPVRLERRAAFERGAKKGAAEPLPFGVRSMGIG